MKYWFYEHHCFHCDNFFYHENQELRCCPLCKKGVMPMHNDKLCDVCGAYFFSGDTVHVTKYETEICDTCTEHQTHSMIAHLFYEPGEVDGDG